MKHRKRNIISIAIVILGLFISSAGVIADPVVENITTDPTSPAPLSDITVTVNITGENISSVDLMISECDETVCFIYNAYPMSKTESGDWTAEATLQDDSARSTHIEYRFDVNDSGVPYTLTDENWRVDLATENGDQNGDGGTTNNGDSNGNGSPGFEIISLLVAVSIGLLLLKRKRLR